MAKNTHCEELLKDQRYDLYIATLYLPERARELATVLYAFVSEMSRVPFIVNEPTLGEVRFQWWRDLLTLKISPAGNPLAQALMEQVESGHAEAVTLENLLAAKVFDLYHDPMPDVETFEAYQGECVSVIMAAIAKRAADELQLNETALADACGHAGVYCGSLDSWTALPHTMAQGKATFPPQLQPEKNDSTSRASPEKLNQFLDKHFEKANDAIAKLPANTRSVFLPIATARQRHALRRNLSMKLNAPLPELSRLAINWGLWRGARKFGNGKRIT